MSDENGYIPYGIRLIGAIYLAFGVLGFLPFDGLNPIHPEGLGARYLLNLVAINAAHNVVHLLIGVTALWASQHLGRAQAWGRVAGPVLLLLAAAGMVQAALLGFPKDQFLLLVPLNSPGHVLHLFTGSMALYLGLARAAVRRPQPGEAMVTPAAAAERP